MYDVGLYLFSSTRAQEPAESMIIIVKGSVEVLLFSFSDTS